MASSIPSERKIIASIGANAMHARNDSKLTTKAGRQAFLDRFEREVDPEGELDPAERRRRASYARQRHMRQLALRSAQARRKAAAP
jgi:hypothetical protein